jgi:hypothetical protein
VYNFTKQSQAQLGHSLSQFIRPDSNKSLETHSPPQFDVHHWFVFQSKNSLQFQRFNKNLQYQKIMALTLNPFWRYIDLKTSEGLKTFNSALHGFYSPLAESAKIGLVPQDFQKLSDQLNCLGSQYGYDHLFKRAATSRTIVSAIPAVAAVAAIAADSTAVPPILAAPAAVAVSAVPETTFYGGFCNMIENYSSDNLKIALINASVIWGNDSFTAQMPQTIKEMTIANGFAMTPTNLKPTKLGEVLQLMRMHSKFMAHQLMALLTPTACQAVKQLKELYTWCTPDGKEEEMDGLTILAIVLNHI